MTTAGSWIVDPIRIWCLFSEITKNWHLTSRSHTSTLSTLLLTTGLLHWSIKHIEYTPSWSSSFFECRLGLNMPYATALNEFTEIHEHLVYDSDNQQLEALGGLICISRLNP